MGCFLQSVKKKKQPRIYSPSANAETNAWQVHEVKYLPPMNGAYGHTVFHNGQASFPNKKVLVFAEPGRIALFLDLCQVH